MTITDDFGHLNFSKNEYKDRLKKTHAAMATAGVDLLIVTDPSNMAWLTGYDGWSFYVHQCVLVPLGDMPVWFGRGMDTKGAMRTVYMPHDHIIGYEDHYVQSTERHPMDYLSSIITDKGWGAHTIGVEMDNYYFSAKAYESLTTNLSNATFKDTNSLVNWLRAIKSDQEIIYMKRAGKIVEAMHARVAEIMQPGLRKNELAAEIYKVGLDGADGHGGDYPAIVPMIPTGADASAPHLTWDDSALESGKGTFFEIAGVHKHYHCPLSRTVYLGTPSQAFLDAEVALQEGLEKGIEAAKPGNQPQDVAKALNDTFARHGVHKDSRCGYSIGLSYPPDWGERTMSMRSGDMTMLEPGMCFHFMPGLWFDDWGIEITESILITKTGAECLANVPRKLVIKD